MTVNVCFHGLGRPRREREPGEAGYWVPVAVFEGVLDLVVDRPEVRLSFDDGNASDVEVALPRLLERGLRATFFPLAGRLGDPGSLGAAELRDLVAAGMRVGSHGMDHRPWPGADAAGLHRELVEARERLEEAVGAPVTRAACPLGRYDRRVLAALRRHGYTWVGTSDRRRARAQDWLQPRYSLRATDSVETFRQEVLEPAPSLRQVGLATRGWLKRLR